MLVVLDTNILVSALLSKNGAPAKILSQALRGRIAPCFDRRIMDEYRDVLHRPKFGFSAAEINALLDWLLSFGRSVIPEPIGDVFVDESDRKFYEVAKFCSAPLITGNARHFPHDPLVMAAADFLRQYGE